jgi:hypothetical protein
VRSPALLLSLLLLACLGSKVAGSEGKILKVLPHLLDTEGRHGLSPSLYERDAYQAHLRQHPDQCSGMRFDVQWKARGRTSDPFRLRLELRGSRAHQATPLVVEQAVKRKRAWSSWSSVKLDHQEWKRLGQVVAWRATLWEGDRQIAEQRSFLW